MWWCDMRRARAVVMLIAALALAACGFTPMYGARDDGTSIAVDLGSIAVEPITEAGRPYRLGQLLENELANRFYQGGVQAVRYRLELDLERTREGFAFRPDEAVTRVGLRLDAHYRLIDTADESIVLEDRAQAYNSFDVIQSDYATLSAEQDMEARLVRDLGQRITHRLSRYFGQRTSERGAATP
ncbi:MAG: hypothetical protein D6763_09240 [Alphaproteobacteria bacterium]|nr:MAG: hypothetical protein D6763_09240 [Alphaproteobacteria bacterium]